MARLYLDERELKGVGLSEPTIRTLRKLTEFVEAQEAIAANGAAIDQANTNISTANTAINALDARIDAYDLLAPFVQQDQAAAPAYSAYAGQTVSAGYVQAEAQATDDAVKAAATALDGLITALQTVNVLT